MRLRYITFIIAVLVFFPQHAFAQLAGDTTAAGDSCATKPTGATAMVADSDSDNLAVVLICDGTNWQLSGVQVPSQAGDPPNADGGGGGSSLWTAGSGDDIYYNSGTPNVGIGDTNPSVALDVVGDIHYTGVLQDVSDIRMKHNIKPLNNPLEKLISLNGFSFTMKDDPKNVIEYGVSAQDVQAVFPELVGVVEPDNGTLGVNYQGLMAPMIEAMKEQQLRIEALESRIGELEAENGALSTSDPPEEL